jgi:hypothetical protein
MTMQIWKLAAGAVVTLGVLSAQGVVVEGQNFQQANTMHASGAMIAPVRVGPGGLGPTVTGKPMSGTEERKTVQTLGDGTQLENSDTNLFYRDSQGRTRTETTVQGRTTIRIMDPVAHTTVQLDPATKTAHKIQVMVAAGRIGSMPLAVGSPQIAGGRQPITGGGGGGRGGVMPAEGHAINVTGTVQEPSVTPEDLGTQTVNGVVAQGTRNTQVIPAGRIGNNRDLRVTNERWFSSEIQMLVKSVNSDPRFGTTTYQLTNISQGEPPANLFQIPADYTVVEPQLK